jgi:RHS repeat-associated protein
MVARAGRILSWLKRYCWGLFVVLLGLLLVLGLSANVYGEDNPSVANSVVAGVTAQSVMMAEADAKATQKTEEDPRMRKQQDNWVDATGAFQYQYPLNLAEGTNNLAPELTLVYNSNVGNGIMGMGWFIRGISEIQRDFNYAVGYDANDHFIYNGEKLLKTSDGYYHMQRENFERIEYNSSQNYWVVTQKDGTKYYYGYQATEHSTNTCGRILAAGDSSKTLLWSLSKVMDIHGNYYIIEYNQDTTNGDYYPVKITYTKNERKPLQAVRTIEFSNELRNDHCVMYNPTKQDMDHRLKWITVKMNGKLLRKWRLDYEYGTATGRSRLTAIQEYGSDGNAPDGWEVSGSFVGTGKVLPKVGFEWTDNNISTNFFVMKNIYVSQNFINSGVEKITGDFNGDGKTDIALRDTTGGLSSIPIYFSNGDGSFNFTNIDVSINWINCPVDIIPGDYNGDGKTDIALRSRNSSDGWQSIPIYFSNGDGSFTITNIAVLQNWINSPAETIPGDFNGDGKTDIALRYPDRWESIPIYFSNGDGSFRTTNIDVQYNWINCPVITMVGDYDGDGKTDIALRYPDRWESIPMYLSNGDGGFRITNIDVQYNWINTQASTMLGDYDGDGKTDIALRYPDRWESIPMYFSNGDGSFRITNISVNENWINCPVEVIPGDFNGDGKIDFTTRYPNRWASLPMYFSNGDGSFKAMNTAITENNINTTSEVMLGDYNGDGKQDIALRKTDGSWSSIPVYFAPLAIPDRLTNVYIPANGIFEITYQPAPQLPGAVVPEGKTYPNLANNSPVPLVTQITFKDGLGEGEGHTVTNTYSYSNGMIRTGLPHERANLGFAWIERKNDFTGSVKTYYHQDDFDLRLMVDKEEVYGTDGKLYTEKSYVYQKRQNTNNPEIKFVYPEREILKNYNGEDGTPVTYRVEYGYDAYGNPNLINDYGDTAVSGDETRIERNFNQFIDSLTYFFPPAYERKYGIKLNGEEGLAAETRFYYNADYTLRRLERENGTRDAATEFGYDDYGNVTAMTDGNGNTTTYTYDDQYQTFLRTQTLKFTEEVIYDALMRPVQRKDANGQIWKTTYDVFSRVKSKVSPGDSVTYPTSRVIYPDEFLDTGGNPIFPQCKKTEKKIADGNYVEVYTYADGLDRVIQEKTEAQGGWVTVDHVYDGAGRESQVSMPYFTTSSSYTAPDSEVKYTTCRFDPVGRLAEVETPDGTKITKYYGKQEVISIDQLGHVTKKRVVGNTEYGIKYTGVYPNQIEYSQVSMTFLVDGIKYIDAVGKEFVVFTDMLGRKVRSTTPVNGTWNYTLDANNNLKTQTNAKNQTITYEYDELNRLTKKNCPDGSCVNYYYDEAGYGYTKGRLTRTEYTGGSESYKYDARGRKTEITQTIGGISKTKKLTYNSLDRVVTQIYPDGEVVTNSYDIGGMLSELKGSSTYLNDIDYYAYGKIKKIVYGNGVQTDYDYYDTAGETDASAGVSYSYRLKQIRVYKSGDLLNLNYEYDKSDNVKVKRDALNANYTETYGYDDLCRLINASSASYGNKTFQYDTINNIRQKDGHTYQYGTVNPYKLVNDGRYSYTYDANGSMIGRSDGRVIGWDYENRVTSISGGSGYVYNANGKRIKKVEGEKTKLYFFPDYEEEYNAGVKTKSVKYYFADKLRIAENSSTTGVCYFHKDHLNSSTVVTDTSGSLVRRIVYAPYGSESASEGTAEVSYKYTDIEKDTTGLYYFGARFYDPEMGRFINVDPAYDGDNWYAFCYNNPLKYRDADGRLPHVVVVGAMGFVAGVAGLFMHDVIVGDFHSFGDYMFAGGIGAVSGLLLSVGNIPAAAAAIRTWQAEAVIQPLLVGMITGTATGIKEKLYDKKDDNKESSSGSDSSSDSSSDDDDRTSRKGTVTIEPGEWGIPDEDGNIVWYPMPDDSDTGDDSDDSDDSDSTDSGGTIICTELFRQGLMAKDIYQDDAAFGKYLNKKYPLVLKGYYFWAGPVVKNMRKSKLFTAIVHKIAKPWYLEMAHMTDKSRKGSFVGKIIMAVGIPLCWLIGLAISNKLLAMLLLVCLIFVIFWKKPI